MKKRKIDILERNFQKDLIKEIKKRFEGCMVFKLDPRLIQGVPDLLILYGPHWAALEVKLSGANEMFITVPAMSVVTVSIQA